MGIKGNGRFVNNQTATELAVSAAQPFGAYWRAASDLSVGQMYLYDNPLLKRPLTSAVVI